MDSLFVRDGDTVRPTEHATSPWSTTTQAGGTPPPCSPSSSRSRPTPRCGAPRATVDILGPVPMAPGRGRVEPVRRGRATELVDAALKTDGRDVLRLGVWRILVTLQVGPSIEINSSRSSYNRTCPVPPQGIPPLEC